MHSLIKTDTPTICLTQRCGPYHKQGRNGTKLCTFTKQKHKNPNTYSTLTLFQIYLTSFRTYLDIAQGMSVSTSRAHKRGCTECIYYEACRKNSWQNT